jgi:glutamyl-tRNA reductase
MRKDPNESLKSWAKRVEKYELETAKKALARGEDINLVLEVMSINIVKKMMHPILNEIRNKKGTLNETNSK